MTEWRIRQKDLKRYPHFDLPLTIPEIKALVTDPKRGAANAFFPLLHYEKIWQPFREKGAKPDPKSRRIRYAARRDSYIYSYYRHLLSGPYEASLTQMGISHCPIAYRRIPTAGSLGGGKCNIHFAKDAFDHIKEFDQCCVIALDISKYFESIDHDNLKNLWCRMLGLHHLPDDHYAVFKSVTKYAFVDRLEAYRRLGFFGTKRISKTGKAIDGYLIDYNAIPTQICSLDVFREKIMGRGRKYSKAFETNKNSWGIPQGTPISDILANIYLIDFDKKVNDICRDLGGYFYRYSDDIIIIAPIDRADALALKDSVATMITDFGPKLIIKDSKTSIVEYVRSGNRHTAQLIAGTQGRNGIEYLGFRFDGRKVYLRDSTLASLHRKIASVARNHASRAARRYPDKGVNELRPLFDFEGFMKKFGRVERFEEVTDIRKWTFWTYVRKAREVFGNDVDGISGQMKALRTNARRRVDSELARAIARRK